MQCSKISKMLALIFQLCKHILHVIELCAFVGSFSIVYVAKLAGLPMVCVPQQFFNEVSFAEFKGLIQNHVTGECYTTCPPLNCTMNMQQRVLTTITRSNTLSLR